MDACACCGHAGSDLRLVGCGCLLHTRCTPLSLVVQHRHVGMNGMLPTTATNDPNANKHKWTLSPNTTSTVYCRFCNQHTTAGIAILPLSFDGLEQSIALRVEAKNIGGGATNNTTGASESGTGGGSKSPTTTTGSPKTTSSNGAGGASVASTVSTASLKSLLNTNNKRGREDSITSDDGLSPADRASNNHSHSSYIVYSQGRKTFNNSLVSDEDLYRTGRWNDEEVEYVDQLVALFDQGLLPITDGTKLATFLGDMLLCKASRLTKKMKNAKLSSRAFSLSPGATMDSAPNLTLQQLMQREKTARQELSVLQESFIKTLPSQSAQIEMRFNVAKQWRSYFSNLCLEVEYPHLDVNGWIASLEELEARSSDAESMLRNVRRRRLGLSSRASSSSFGGSTSVPRPISTQSMTVAGDDSARLSKMVASSSSSAIGLDFTAMSGPSPNDAGAQVFMPKSITGTANGSQQGHASGMDDFENDMMFLMGQEIVDFGEAPAVSAPPPALSELRDWARCGNPFLEAVSVYLQEQNLPFQYADVWVPSLTDNTIMPTAAEPAGKDDKMNADVCLLPAGYITRDDQDESLSSAMSAFGEYSKAFSFKPGIGLPGRVYMSGRSAWQKALDTVHPSVFARVSGAKTFGLRTAAAIPFSAPGVGRMIVVMYSTSDIPVDWSLTDQCSNELSRYSPQPKWKLVIEIGSSEKETENGDGRIIEEVHDAPIEEVQITGSPSGQNTVSPSNIIEPLSDQAVEKRLISLLGDQMPAFQSASSDESISSTDAEMKELLPDIMRMRLLMLRTPEKRSQDDNDCIEVLKSSFKNYIEESKRSDREIATLLAREWKCLKMYAEETSPPFAPSLPTDQGKMSDDSKMPASNILPDKYKSSALSSPPILAGQAAMPKALAQPFSLNRPNQPMTSTDNSILVYDHSPNIPGTTIQKNANTVPNAPSLVNVNGSPFQRPPSFLPQHIKTTQ